MSDNTSTTRFPRYSPWVALHCVTFILLYNLATKVDRLTFTTYTVLYVFMTIVFTVSSLVRLAHVRRQRPAAPRK